MIRVVCEISCVFFPLILKILHSKSDSMAKHTHHKHTKLLLRYCHDDITSTSMGLGTVPINLPVKLIPTALYLSILNFIVSPQQNNILKQ